MSWDVYRSPKPRGPWKLDSFYETKDQAEEYCKKQRQASPSFYWVIDQLASDEPNLRDIRDIHNYIIQYAKTAPDRELTIAASKLLHGIRIIIDNLSKENYDRDVALSMFYALEGYIGYDPDAW